MRGGKTVILCQAQNDGKGLSSRGACPETLPLVSSRSVPIRDLALTRNQQRTTNNRSYHPTMVLAQRVGNMKARSTVSPVSIPLWFSLNEATEFPVERLATFPSHYGSRSEEPSFVVRPRSWTRPWKRSFSFRRCESRFLALGSRQRKERDSESSSE